MARPDLTVLRVGTEARVDQAPVEARSLLGCFERYGVGGGARGTEIIRDAADGDNQRVVGQGTRGNDLPAFVIERCADMNEVSPAVEASHLTQAVVEMMDVSVGEVVQLVLSRVHAASGHGVQQWLPQVGAGPFHQCHVGAGT